MGITDKYSVIKALYLQVLFYFLPANQPSPLPDLAVDVDFCGLSRLFDFHLL
jgi:hypothetical protein